MKHHAHFLELFLKNQGSLYAFILSRGIVPEAADDVFQNMAAALWEKFETFEPGSNFRAWAFAVARIEVQRYRDQQRGVARQIQLDGETLQKLEDLETTGNESLLDFRKEQLARCLQKIGASERALVKMRYGDRTSFDDIARRLQVSATAARIRLCRIRQWLRNCVLAGLRAREA